MPPQGDSTADKVKLEGKAAAGNEDDEKAAEGPGEEEEKLDGDAEMEDGDAGAAAAEGEDAPMEEDAKPAAGSAEDLD